MPAAVAVRMMIVLAAALCCATAASADETAALLALREGRPIALLRHALAPGSAGDPPGFRLGDCATQRNLSAEGREQARRAGLRLKAARVKIGKVLSSPWCRCLETARLLDLGDAETARAFSNAFVLAGERAELTRAAKALIAAWRGPGALLVVTHGENIAALTGINPREGEIVVVDVESCPTGLIPDILDRADA